VDETVSLIRRLIVRVAKALQEYAQDGMSLPQDGTLGPEAEQVFQAYSSPGFLKDREIPKITAMNAALTPFVTEGARIPYTVSDAKTAFALACKVAAELAALKPKEEDAGPRRRTAHSGRHAMP
jgi:hypothetical protein